ncbi:MAG: excinuclease subunit [Alphaproteobacteria bacterium]|nr:excinuclease subunit [Alphaproteobacteria bacterium]
MAQDKLIVRGARAHNLKNITVELPRNQLVVITGLSGSGKSSLAFDTIYAEGQRRYVESLSAYARQFLDMMQKPDVDSIEGLSPAISIEQKTTSKNPRSTVGTVTEIYDYMRLLWARIGVPYSPMTGLPIQAQTTSQMVDRVLAFPEETKLMILAPVIRGRKGEYRKEMLEWRKKGFQRIRVGGKFHELDTPPTLDKQVKHDIEVVIDRIKVRPDAQQRLSESIETALNLADGLVLIENTDTNEKHVFSSKFACPESGFTIEEIEPRLFSFNSPFGACPACDGLGVIEKFMPDLVVPDGRKTLRQGAVAPWNDSPYYSQTLDSLARHMGISVNTPWDDLEAGIKKLLLFGTKEPVKIAYADGVRSYNINRPFEGIIPNLERRNKETASTRVRDDLSRYLSEEPCEGCKGYRLKPEALAVKIDAQHIAMVSDLSIKGAVEWFTGLPKRLSKKDNQISEKILKEITERLFFLDNVGLPYLSLSRKSGTLSGGESQRIRLASQIGSGLTGVLYVLDEPSIGLHQRDNDRLLVTLKRLRDLGNTVIVVEHDEDAIRTADYLVDMGPGAGIHGGHVIAAGLPEEVFANTKSITADYMTGRRSIPVPKTRREGHKTEGKKGTVKAILLEGATGNNLQNVTASFPLGTFTCVTGVSGSGKSSLTIDTLYAALANRLNGERTHPSPFKKITGLEHIDKVIDIDQSPIGRTPRSNPATYTGAFTFIRDWFAGLPESKARGYQPGRFSFNVKGGRCEACQGDGLIKIEMHFLPDVYVTCDVCKGKRYARETLEVLYKGKSIADILDMTVDEAADFFKAVPPIRDKMETLKKVGLGYIHVGQQATTLSGGEAQRIKLSKELSKRATGRTVYILDEPTTGLHMEDTRKLLEVLHTLVDTGNTVIVIEHNLEVIKTADWLVDMGPEGGNGGGQVVAIGTPEDVVKVKASYTGHYLKPLLSRKAVVKEEAPANDSAKKKKRA